jgi:hypothetical protein
VAHSLLHFDRERDLDRFSGFLSPFLHDGSHFGQVRTGHEQSTAS